MDRPIFQKNRHHLRLNPQTRETLWDLQERLVAVWERSKEFERYQQDPDAMPNPHLGGCPAEDFPDESLWSCLFLLRGILGQADENERKPTTEPQGARAWLDPFGDNP